MANTRFDKRMEDKLDIPEMNGTLRKIVELLGAPLDNHEQNSEAIRENTKLNLHIYLLEKRILEQLTIMNKWDERIKGIFVDKVLPQFITFAIMGLLYLLFQNYHP
jgi:hypothetical protein